MGDARRAPGTRARRAPAVLLVVLAAVLSAAALAACGSPALSGQDDALTGYWIGGGESGMRLVHITKEGDSYRVLANPDFEAPGPKLKDGALVVDTHSVVMSLIPAGTDKLDLQLSGQMFETPQTTALKRVDKTQYADAATSLGIDTIRQGLADWKAGGGKKYPPPAEVTPSGHARQDGQLAQQPVHGPADAARRDPGRLRVQAARRRQEVLARRLPLGRQHDRQDAGVSLSRAAAGRSPAGSLPR